MFNEKMEAVKSTIENVIDAVFPSKYLDYVFSGKIEPEDVVFQILMECCKYAHDTVSDKHSLRYHLQRRGMSEDDTRMVVQRTVKKINTFRQAEYGIRKAQSGIELEGLLAKNMCGIDEKIAGYEYNDFQFWEIQNVHDMKLVNVIINGQISKKNFKNEMFRSCADEYDKTVNSFLSQTGRGDCFDVFASLALFTLEWKYAFDFYYEIAAEMESNKIAQIPDLQKRCSLFCGPAALFSRLNFIDSRIVGGSIHTDSRMLLLRKKFIHEFVCMSKEEFEKLTLQYIEAMVVVSNILVRMTYRGVNIREWFVINTEIKDWAAVMREYDVAKCFISNKEWTNKRIRYVKEIYASIHTDIKNPDFGS